LLGHVATMARPRAELALVTGQGDPLLAHWQYGLGRTVAFTSDARAKWARNWIGWDRYQQFWQQVVQWSLRRVESADFDTQVAIEGGEGRVSIEALDAQGEFRNFLNLEAAVVSPKGERQMTRFEQTGPGRYQAKFSTRETGTYLLNLQELEQGRLVASQVVGASLSYSPEFSAREPNLNLLRRIAEVTGGKELIPGRLGSNPFFDDRQPSFQPQELWEHLLRLAIVLMVLDIGFRRVQFDAEDWQRISQAALAYLPFLSRTQRSPPAGQPSLAALLARREDARAGRLPEPDLFRPVATTASGISLETARPSDPTSNQPNELSPRETPEPRHATSRLLAAKRRAQRK
ncbi:MAG TPA: hypothetical protein DCE44_16080, partial [Verrucomicrobiales bacterium]|nr:hypothetical protein [Verrucomicrobiales bacterium]